MRFDILTLFPEAFESFCKTSIIKRAIEANKIEINCFNIRNFSQDKHKKVDDTPYGGGAGMVMMPQPLFDSIEYVKNLETDTAPVIFFTPSPNIFNQKMAELFAMGKSPQIEKEQPKQTNRYIILCGHYEGIDQRVRDRLVDLEISMGNFVLTGGELPAQIFIDAVSRLLPGVIGKEESYLEESFSENLGRDRIEYPHYTRPENFRGLNVPEVLLSGHHAQIKNWKNSNLYSRN